MSKLISIAIIKSNLCDPEDLINARAMVKKLGANVTTAEFSGGNYSPKYLKTSSGVIAVGYDQPSTSNLYWIGKGMYTEMFIAQSKGLNIFYKSSLGYHKVTVLVEIGTDWTKKYGQVTVTTKVRDTLSLNDFGITDIVPVKTTTRKSFRSNFKRD